MTRKTIIFDFDGTIADTFSILLNIYNESASNFNCRRVEKADIEKLRSQRPQQFLKDYGVSTFKIPIMALYIKRQLARHILEIEVVDGMPWVIKELKKEGLSLGILTSNSRVNVEKFLAQNELLEYFDFVRVSKNVFRKDRALLKIINKQRLNKADVIYVGDETRDVEACKRAGIKIIAVTWGFNSAASLERQHSDILINSTKELRKVIF